MTHIVNYSQTIILINRDLADQHHIYSLYKIECCAVTVLVVGPHSELYKFV